MLAQGEYATAHSIYTSLATRDAMAPELPETLKGLIQSADGLNSPEYVKQALTSLSVALKNNSSWTVQFAKTPAAESRKKVLVEELRERAHRAHAQAQSRNREDLYAVALEQYTAFLNAVPEDKESFDAYFYRGEIYVHTKQYLLAAESYLKSVELNHKLALKNPLAKEASKNAISVFESGTTAEKKPVLPEAGMVPEPVTMPPTLQKFVMVLKSHVVQFPDDTK